MRRALPLLLLALAACGNDDAARAPAAALRVDVIGAFDEAGSRTTLDGPRAVLNDATQQGLVDLDASGQVVPGLATSWRVSDDGLSYIFRLRDAEWEDGRAVTAGDVVAVYRRIVARGSNHPLKGLLAPIENAPAILARKASERTLGVDDPLPNIVEIRLTAPTPGLLAILAHSSMSILRQGPIPPAIGAFTVAEGPRPPIVLRRNPGYHDAGSVPLGRITLQPSPEAVEAIGRFRRGATDVVTGGTTAGLTEARAAPPDTLHIEPTHGVYAYLANVGDGPLADPRVRRALAMAIDRTALIQSRFALAEMQPVTGVAPPSTFDAVQPDWASWLYETRIVEARRLLAEAGYGADDPLVVQLALPAGQEHAAVANAVARAWGDLSVEVRPITRRAALHADAVADGQFQLAVVETIAPVPSSSLFMAAHACGASRGGYCNREADALAAQALAARDLDERRALVRRAEALFVGDTPAITLFTPVRWSLVDPRVAGWVDNIAGAHPLSRLDVLPTRRRR